MIMKLEEALKAYEDCFGESYFFYMGFTKTDQEIVEEIQKCIKTGTKEKIEEIRNNMMLTK